MKTKAFKIIASFLVLVAFIFTLATINVMSIPENIKVSEGRNSIKNIEKNNLKSNLIYTLNTQKEIGKKNINKKLDINIKLFGVIPVKKVTLSFMPEVKLVPGGQPIGVKLYTEGVLVVGFADIESKTGRKQSPAALSGVEIGDSILEVNKTKITSNEQVSDIIKKSGKSVLEVKIKRRNEVKIIKIKPVCTKTKNEYKIGIWIRDYTAGVGTLTFYDPNSGSFGALGHPINDVDTGKLISVRDGKIYNAKIVSVEQGVKGKPGELKGMFSEDDEIGNLNKNTDAGIFGNLEGLKYRGDFNNPIPIARQSEIKEGAAKILTAIEGAEVKEYDIYIEKLTQQSKPGCKSMIIRITDKELLEKTGGIVQGMSGSPIIQNGKLVGAVTHVFVNRPDMGYGIYIEWMLDELEDIK